jgi:hypothetical protein
VAVPIERPGAEDGRGLDDPSLEQAGRLPASNVALAPIDGELEHVLAVPIAAHPGDIRDAWEGALHRFHG